MAVRTDADGEDFTRALALGSITALTVCGWFRRVVDRNDYSTIFSIDNGTSDNWLMQTGVDGDTMNTVFDASTQQGIGVMTLGTWYFICLATSGTTGNIYYRTPTQSGLTTVAVTSVTATINAATLRIGESPWGAEWWNGDMANVNLWTAQLTAAEALQESTRYVPYRYANLAAWYPLTRPADTTDYSGNGRTLSGGTNSAYADGPPIPWYTTTRPRIILPASGGGPINVTLNRATETDSANTLTRSKTASLARTTETDTSRVLSVSKAAPLTRATESDLARILSRSKNVPLLRAAETDTSRALSGAKQVPLLRASGTESSRIITPSKTLNLLRASETDTARTLSVSKTVNLSRVTSTDVARTLTKSALWNLLRASETESANSLHVAKIVLLSRTVETDLARILSAGQPVIVTLGRAVDSSIARTFGVAKVVHLDRAASSDIGRGLVLQKLVALTHAIEVSEARALSSGEDEDYQPPDVSEGVVVRLLSSTVGAEVKLVRVSSGLVVVQLQVAPGQQD